MSSPVPAPITPTYEELAKYAWPLLQTLTSNPSQPAKTFLGLAGTAIVERHFTAGWLDKIKIGTYGAGVPAPVLKDLWTAMGYPDQASFKTECDKIHAKLFAVLGAFTNGAGFTGITYNTTIYVTSKSADDLTLVMHELVHSLQWFHYAKTGFLRRYIEGFVTAPDYKSNPAEARAYAEQNKFKNAANAELLKAKQGTLAKWGGAIRKAANATGAGSLDKDLPIAIAALMQMPKLGLTATTACTGMPV
jgi:hypothetical protein